MPASRSLRVADTDQLLLLVDAPEPTVFNCGSERPLPRYHSVWSFPTGHRTVHRFVQHSSVDYFPRNSIVSVNHRTAGNTFEVWPLNDCEGVVEHRRNRAGPVPDSARHDEYGCQRDNDRSLFGALDGIHDLKGTGERAAQLSLFATTGSSLATRPSIPDGVTLRIAIPGFSCAVEPPERVLRLVSNLVDMRIVPGGWRYGLSPLVISPLATLLSPPVGIVLFAVGIGILAFFRDPQRTPPADGIVSPADGRVTLVRREDGRVRVGVFMNVTDVHVNRAPIQGRIEDIRHRPGAHRPAFSKESDRNERVDLRIVGAMEMVDVSLIAGAFARRISPYVEGGDEVSRGQRIGHIAFGSRADVLLPPDVDADELAVAVGDRVRAGETHLVDLQAHPTERAASDR